MNSAEMNTHPYPLFLDLTDRRVLVVGGGRVAERRVMTLVASGARLTVIAPEATEWLMGQSERGVLALYSREFAPKDVEGYLLVFSATGIDEVDARVATAARTVGALVNVADDASKSDFHVPAIERREHIQLAVGTGGAAPGLAARLRDRLASAIGPEWDAFAELIAETRVLARRTMPTREERMDAIRTAANDRELFALVSRGAPPPPTEVLAKHGSPRQPEITSPVGKARVSIVGAGPGHPDLITIRGHEAIASADVVIYDDLVDRRLLDIAPAHAELVYFGKRGWRDLAARPPFGSIVLRALERDGKHVVRLKGGDPSIFGRLSEEIQALESAGIPYEVIPGVTAAVAAAAAAKVSLTRRGEARSVTLASAIVARDEGGADSADEEGLVRMLKNGGVVVVYMGLRSIRRIAQRLIAQGIDPALPVIIAAGVSTPEEQIVRTALVSAADDAQRSGLGSPALILLQVDAGR